MENTRTLDGDNDSEDRLDFWGLAMPADNTPDEERVNRRVAHQKAEIVARNMTGKTEIFIPGTFDRRGYRRLLITINGITDEWGSPDKDEENDASNDDDKDGSFWVVS